MPRSPFSLTNALTGSTFHMTGWRVCWLLMVVPTPSRSREISTRKWRPFCRRRRVEPTSLCHRRRTRKLRRSDDQSIAVGCFWQCPDSGRHGRPYTWRERNEMVAYFFNAYIGQARCGVGGHGNHSRSKPETCRLDRGEWQELDGDLRNPWPRRSFLWRRHDSEEISKRA